MGSATTGKEEVSGFGCEHSSITVLFSKTPHNCGWNPALLLSRAGTDPWEPGRKLGGGSVFSQQQGGTIGSHSETDKGTYILQYMAQSHTAFKYPTRTFKSKPNPFLYISRSNPRIGLVYLIYAKFSTIATI